MAGTRRMEGRFGSGYQGVGDGSDDNRPCNHSQMGRSPGRPAREGEGHWRRDGRRPASARLRETRGGPRGHYLGRVLREVRGERAGSSLRGRARQPVQQACPPLGSPAPATDSPPRAFLRDNGLTIALSTLFIFSIAAMGLTGWKAHNTVLLEHGTAPLGLLSYLRSGDFASAVFENWESEFLQMAAYVILTAFLFQRGSAEFADPDGEEEFAEHAASLRLRKLPPRVLAGDRPRGSVHCLVRTAPLGKLQGGRG